MQSSETVAATEHILALRNYPRKPAYLAAALEDLFTHFGRIPDASKAVLSDYFNIDRWPDHLIDSLFHATTKKRKTIKVCNGPCCHEVGSDQLAEQLKRELGRTIDRQHCMGRCQNIPVAMVGGEVIPNATLAKVRAQLD